ncbi:MAG TPA: SRPBCC domain-containing protein [Casimicrobiaceae bacterium]|nr:SRPBCC domain-containing protein [Casimicrobiaceae bacterium]
MKRIRRSCRRFAAAVLVVFAGALAPWAASAQSQVEDLSSVGADGTRVLEQRVLVPAPADEVWKAWATSEGFGSWVAPFARVDLRLGGSMEASFNDAAKPGDRDNIRNEIVALVPGRLFAIRNVQAPANAPFDVPVFQTLHTVVLFEPKGPGSTQVTVIMPGVGSGPAHDGVYKHFAWGNRYTLDALRKRFVDGPTDWAKVREAMRSKK